MHARFAFPPPSLADRLFLQASRSCSVRERRRFCTWSEEISLEDSPLPRTWKPRTLSRSRTTETPSTESTNTSPIEDCSHTRTRKHQTGNRLLNRGNLNALLDERCFLSQGFRDGGPFTPNASPIGDRSHTQTQKHRTGKCLPNHENLDSLSTSVVSSIAERVSAINRNRPSMCALDQGLLTHVIVETA